MIHPIPPGTRDVLPDEMRELRKLDAALLDVFEAHGYGEVATPAIEYDEVLARGSGRTADSAYRFFDERGDLLALRSDMTVPIARLVASRYEVAEMPLRLCYLANAFRAVRPQRGQMREFAQAGVELIGAPAPQGTVDQEIAEGWAKLNDTDGVIPYLDYTTPTFYDDITAAIQELLGGKQSPSQFTSAVQKKYAAWNSSR